MSFRIKPTHELLRPLMGQPQAEVKQVAQPANQSQNPDLVLNPLLANNKPQPKAPQHPNTGSGQGMAIRTVPAAQADYM